MRKLFSVWLILVGVSAFGDLLQDEQNNVDVYQKSSGAVVNITSVQLQRDFFFEIVPQKGVGSGVVIKDSGYILTNDHVVGKAHKLEVTFADKTTFPAKLVGSDPDTDLAVIKIEPGETKLTSLTFGDPSTLRVGQKVLAIGNPFGLGGSLSVGIISSLERDIRTPTDRLIKDVIQTDAAINPGNSGGPLLDSSGRVIGINTQIVSTSGGSVGVGFAISVKTAQMVVNHLIEFGEVQRPKLGLYGVGLSAGLLQALKVPIGYGIMVTELVRGGASHRAGIKPANREIVFGFRRIPFGGDVIFRVDDTPVQTMRDLLDVVFEKKVGDTVVLHFFRGSKRMKVTAKLTASVKGSSSGKGL